jgi:hypothetical protein
MIEFEPKNAKYIGYKCVKCDKDINENERQKIIALGFWQTWCILCACKKYPDDKYLHQFAVSNGEDDTIILIKEINEQSSRR